MRELQRLYANNRNWAQRMTHADPDFFLRLAEQQFPEYLWIGCSDSRVPANEIVGLLPGELFVHRNVANQIIHNDINCMSDVQYAVEVLRVKHIIVCGHYGCGGVQAAIDPPSNSLVNQWLGHLRDLYQKHEDALKRLAPREQLVDRLCELNVMEQVRHLIHSPVVQQAWCRQQPLWVHGWIYRVTDCHLPPYTKPLSVAQPKPPLAADLSQSCAANLSHA